MDNEKIFNILVALATAAAIFMEVYSRGGTSSLIILSSIFAAGLVYWVAVWVNLKFNRIERIETALKKLDEKVEYMARSHEIDKRLVALEAKAFRKGQVNPQTILFVVVMLLFLLYLRVRGLRLC